MATEPLSIVHTASKTVFFYFLNALTDEVFDFNDNSWKANLGACTTPKLAATEKTDFGDSDESLYIASTDVANMNATSTAMFIAVQGWDDLATDAIIGTEEMVVANGLRMDGDVGALLSRTGATAVGTASINDILIMLYSMAQGRIARAGDVYTFYDDDDATVLATLTIAAAARTN